MKNKTKAQTEKYKIKIDYTTGDSFHTEDRTAYLEHSWSDESVAISNMKRIEEHYRWYIDQHSYFPDDIKRPTWHKKRKLDEACLILHLDDGSEWQFWAFWCGYFESLNCVEIVRDNYKIDFRG